MKSLNIQFIIDSGNDGNDEKIREMLKNQIKMQNKLLPSAVKVLIGEE